MDWFDPHTDTFLTPDANRKRIWQKRFGQTDIEVSSLVVYANNGHGRLFDASCLALDHQSGAVCLTDLRLQGYALFQRPDGAKITLFRAPEPAPYAAAELELLISRGGKQFIFLNGCGSLNPTLRVGKLVLPGGLVREEGTSYHYAPPGVRLCCDANLSHHFQQAAQAAGIGLAKGDHWTTDAIYRETFAKVERMRTEGVISVDMELSALAGVTFFRRCTLCALLVVTDVLELPHHWGGVLTTEFQEGVLQAAHLVAQVVTSIPAGSDPLP
jgi:uridine phosphorylase